MFLKFWTASKTPKVLFKTQIAVPYLFLPDPTAEVGLKNLHFYNFPGDVKAAFLGILL